MICPLNTRAERGDISQHAKGEERTPLPNVAAAFRPRDVNPCGYALLLAASEQLLLAAVALACLG